jgi:CSLREA domain-containing protein
VHGRDRRQSVDKQEQTQPRATTTRQVFPVALRAIAIGAFGKSGTLDIAIQFIDNHLEVWSKNQEAGEQNPRLTEGLADWHLSTKETLSQSAHSLVTARLSTHGTDDLVVVGDSHQIRVVGFSQGRESENQHNAKEPGITLSSRGYAQLETEDGSARVALPMRLNGDALTDLVFLNSDRISPIVSFSGSDSKIWNREPSPAVVSSGGTLTTARSQHTATLLTNGKVLVVGGEGNGGFGNSLSGSEIFDPATNNWSDASSLTVARSYHSATRLVNGKVLVAGGRGNSGALASAELYDPTTNLWSSAGNFVEARYYHTATLLPNGKVLIVGGTASIEYFASASLYDPATNAWTSAGNLTNGRFFHSATLLQNGKVLVAGGSGSTGALASAELYDPVTNSWSPAGSLLTARSFHAATLLSNGKTLVSGGLGRGTLGSVELYEQATNTWSGTDHLITPRYSPTSTLLSNGTVLIAGGVLNNSLARVEFFDPSTLSWRSGINLSTPRSGHTATLLPSGKVLIAAGSGTGGVLASAETYDPTILPPTPMPTILTVNSSLDTDDGICNLSNCTLREAINAANSNPGSDTIRFSIGSGLKTISPASQLPFITDTVTIDGSTQPGFNGMPLIEINGTNAGQASGLFLYASNSVIRGLVINRFSGSGIYSNSPDAPASGNIFEGNFLGTDPTGLLAQKNGQNAIFIAGTINNLIGGTTSQAGNVIAGNVNLQNGLGRPNGNVIQGNKIGTDSPGTTFLGGDLIIAGGSYETIGGTIAGARNILMRISIGNSGGPSFADLIQGNFVGTDVTGTRALGGGGILLSGAIGIESVSGNTIGGTTISARNVISGNLTNGITLDYEEVRNNQIQGNYIGVDVTGNQPLGNAIGVDLGFLSGTGNTVGGTVTGARNTISANRNIGVNLGTCSSAGSVTVQNNLIGTDSSGLNKLGNAADGVKIFMSSFTQCAKAVSNNVISNNAGHGVNIFVSGASSQAPINTLVTLSDNQIGTDINGSADMGNAHDGVFLGAQSGRNTIRKNTIAYNGDNGVNVPGTTSSASLENIIEENAIFKNRLMGINLGDQGITANDFQDPDIGGNTLQNFPVLTSFGLSSQSSLKSGLTRTTVPRNGRVPDDTQSTIIVNGTLNSTPNTTFIINYYFSADVQCVSNQPQSPPLVPGRIPGITTDANGNASFSFPFEFPLGFNRGVINTTATNPNNNTSEFSSCIPVNEIPSIAIADVSKNETNSGTTQFSFAVSLSLASAQTVTVNYSTANGTATVADNDYGAVSGTLTFNPGDTTKNVVVQVNGDTKFEPDETFVVNLSAATNATIADSQGQGTIVNDDSAPSISIADVALAEGNAGTKSFTFGVTLSNPTTQTVSVNYATGDGTATLADYQAANGTLTFNPGEINKSLFVSVTGDSVLEPDETFFVNLSSNVNASIADAQGTGTILNDDGVPTPAGSNVVVQSNGVEVTFAQVNMAGATAFTTINPSSTGQLPAGYFISGSSLGVDLSTTATYSAPLDICFTNSAVTDPLIFGNLSVLHSEGGQLIDRTTSHDFQSKKVCGRATSFSPFILVDKVTMKYSAANYEVFEGAGFITVSVTRIGNSANNAQIDFATADGSARQRVDYTIAAGTLKFAAGENTRTFRVLIVDDVYVEGAETLSLNLTNPSGGLLDNPASVTLTIQDNDSATPVDNPLDDARFFVKEQYYDFLSRYPDQSGWDYWSGQISQCGTDPACLRTKRIDVSNAFFFELEFQQTGAFVYRMYRVAYGNNQPFPNPDNSNQTESKKLPRYSVFASDRARVIGGANLAAGQLALASAFVQRPEFLLRYPASLDGPGFVDAVLSTIATNTGVSLATERSALIDLFNQGGRANVLYRLADDNLATNPINNRSLIDAEYNRAFVATQYFGYLRRDADIGGFLFWLGQVNSASLRDVQKQHAMVCSFITSSEYQQRFSPVASHSNVECE